MLVLCGLIMLWAHCSPSPVASPDGSSSGSGSVDWSGATEITAPGSTPGSIDGLAVSDAQRYHITIPAGGDLTITTTGSTDTFGTLYDASFAELTYDDDSGTDYNFVLNAIPAGEYYLEITGYDLGAYTLEISQTSSTVLRPQRDGTDDATDLYLIDAASGTKIADNGSGVYDGTSGVAVSADTTGASGTAIAANDTVGVPYPYDSAKGAAFGYFVGLPTTKRGTEDNARLSFSTIDYIAVPGGLSASDFGADGFTVAFRFRYDLGRHFPCVFAAVGDCTAPPGSGTITSPFALIPDWAKQHLRFAAPGFSTLSLNNVFTSNYSIYDVVVSASPTTARAYVYRGGALVGSGSVSGTLATFTGSDWLVGQEPRQTENGVPSLSIFRIYSAPVTSDAQAQTLFSWSSSYDRTFGGTLVHSLDGARSGVHLESESEATGTTLLYAGGPGTDALTAQEHA